MTKTLFFRLFGLGRVPKSFRERLSAEGILHEEEGFRVTTTLRRFKAPWRYVLHKKSSCSGSLVVTAHRLIAFGRSRTAINIPWVHPSFDKLRIEVESPSVLLIEYEAEHFVPEASGTVELRFRLADPAAARMAIEAGRRTTG